MLGLDFSDLCWTGKADRTMAQVTVNETDCHRSCDRLHAHRAGPASRTNRSDQRLADEMSQLQNLFSPFPQRPTRLVEDTGKGLPGQIWLAVVGVSLVELSLFAYFQN
jgi:hypothetical protein